MGGSAQDIKIVTINDSTHVWGAKIFRIIFQFVWFFRPKLPSRRTKRNEMKTAFRRHSKKVQLFIRFVAAFQRGSRHRLDARGPLERLHLHQPPLLLPGRLWNSSPREAWASGSGLDNGGGPCRADLLFPGMDARKVGKSAHQRRRVDVPWREQLCDVSRQVPRVRRQGRVRLNRPQIFAPPDDRLRRPLAQLRPLPPARFQRHGVPIR